MVKHRIENGTLPGLIFITDHKRVPHGEAVIAALPAGSAVIIRDYDHNDRAQYALKLVQIAHRHGVRALVAKDSDLARNIGADGFHMPEYQLNAPMPPRQGFSLVTAAAKSLKSMQRAADIGVDMVLYSPIFKTRSHIGAKAKGIHLLARVIDHAPLPVAALGGINEKTEKKLKGINIAAIAAIDGLC